METKSTMSENASERGEEQRPDTPNNDEDSMYDIDETVTLDGERTFETWDLDIDPNTDEVHVYRAIARSARTQVQLYIIPKEEVQFYENGESIWWEHKSNHSSKVSDRVSISNEDEEPYKHDGNYVLLVDAESKSGDDPKFSVKFRRE
jgi:hypothetical protein